MTTHHESLTVNVFSQNVFLAKGLTSAGRILPQDDRIESIAATLNSFDGSLDVVGVQEAFKSDNQHNGEVLAELCGYEPGFWLNHNQKKPGDTSNRGRAGEYIGMFGSLVDHVKPIGIGDNRLALITEIAGVAFVTYHLRAGVNLWARRTRAEQAEIILDAVADYPDAVLIGDDNEPNIPRISQARNAFMDAEFQSALTLAGHASVKTFPSEPYRKIHRAPRMWLDDISVRGERVRVLGAGILERVEIETTNAAKFPAKVPRAGSDHDGVYARLEIAA